jgi:hypothetical protein
MGKRVFLLGDSFTENLYQTELEMRMNGDPAVGEIRKYIDYIIDATGECPLYFDDWLRKWGYEVHNFGMGGCSIHHIFNQFAQIDSEFRPGDRLIVNWTDPQRLDWLSGDGRISTLGPNQYAEEPKVMRAIQDQLILRMKSIQNEDGHGYLRNQTLFFASKLVDLHAKYKPIQWSPFGDISESLKSYVWYFFEPHHRMFKDFIPEWDMLFIDSETGGICNDKHYSRLGNYYVALAFKTIMEEGDEFSGDWKNESLLERVTSAFKNDPPNFAPVNWKLK